MKRVLWKQIAWRLKVIGKACHQAGIHDLDEHLLHLMGDSSGGCLETAIRNALARKNIVSNPRLRNVLRALYRWEHRQCLKVGYPTDLPGPNGIPMPISLENERIE